ncbi:DUF4942 domain-containing protein [Endozoicomonas sp. ALC066]|uniref:DUF4942 domain-containing protein n=1 Tax=Endozoicomonas sp. ALC066 TaxID=3403078 RepID=UPI003BB6464B
MSTTTQTSAFESVNNERTELIKSVSIQNTVSLRDACIERLSQAIELLGEAYSLSVKAGAKRGVTLNDLINSHRYCRYNDLSSSNERKEIVEGLAKTVDSQIWSYLMEQSNMVTMMDAQARGDWNDKLTKGSFPEISMGNIISTFDSLNNSKGELFERGVINVIKSLSWDYKSNLPVKFGKKIILDHVIEHSSYSLRMSYGRKRDQLSDLERVMCVLDGRPVPEFRNDIASRLDSFIKEDRFSGKPYVDNYFSIRYFKKGSIHIRFLKTDLVDRLNEIITRHYPGALPPAV